MTVVMLAWLRSGRPRRRHSGGPRCRRSGPYSTPSLDAVFGAVTRHATRSASAMRSVRAPEPSYSRRQARSNNLRHPGRFRVRAFGMSRNLGADPLVASGARRTVWRLEDRGATLADLRRPVSARLAESPRRAGGVSQLVCRSPGSRALGSRSSIRLILFLVPIA